MNAKYFYNWLLGYDKESKRTNTSYHGYENGYVCIHHKGDNQKWFRINKDGTVHEQSVYKTYNTFHINDMKGDDYELFSTHRLIQSGYIILGDPVSTTDSHVKSIITEIHRLIRDREDVYMPDGRRIYNHQDFMGGRYTVSDKRGVKSKIGTLSPNGIELHIQTLRELDKENINRKHYGATTIPTSDSVKETNTLHVSLIFNITNESMSDVWDRSGETLSQLLAYISKAGVDNYGIFMNYDIMNHDIIYY